jgi:hypothetical protein
VAWSSSSDAAQWQERRHSRDPHWRGITRDAIRLTPAFVLSLLI